jgi:hypothetical protein
MIDLKRRHILVLEALSKRPDVYIAQTKLPNGNGHCMGNKTSASSATMKELTAAGLVEYGKKPLHSMYGYKITNAGISALIFALRSGVRMF